MADWQCPDAAICDASSEIKIPDIFWSVPYNGAHYPGGAGVEGLKGGANCQQFAYELLRQNGFVISNLRSSELWADTMDTVLVAGDLAPGDLLLFNRTPQSWGAHVAVYLGRDQAIHLARHIGKPTIWALSEFNAPLYANFIGAKRPIRRQHRAA
jgi:cell wall-associated NlpC family hydrolase